METEVTTGLTAEDLKKLEEFVLKVFWHGVDFASKIVVFGQVIIRDEEKPKISKNTLDKFLPEITGLAKGFQLGVAGIQFSSSDDGISLEHAHKAQKRLLISARAKNISEGITQVRIKDYYDDSKWHTPEELAVIKKVEEQVVKEDPFYLTKKAQKDILVHTRAKLRAEHSTMYEKASQVNHQRLKEIVRKKELLEKKGINYETPQERALKDNIIL